MNIGPYSYDEFVALATDFHGFPAPGLLIGGYMVALAKRHIPEKTLFEAVSETPKCLPDAVQLLTQCTFGNARLRTVNLGRYAVTLYDKLSGEGVRVYLDPAKLDSYPEIKAWYLRTKPKKDRDSEKLYVQIRHAGDTHCTVQPVRVSARLLGKKSLAAIGLCPSCGEPYSLDDGAICRGCLGEAHYLVPGSTAAGPGCPELRPVPVEAAIGKRALHDMTRIVPNESKGAEFTAGQQFTGTDICRLQQMGRMNVYTEEDRTVSGAWVHENDAVTAFAERMAGEGITYAQTPQEGKIDFFPAVDGLLIINREVLRAFNMVPDVMCATRRGDTYVTAGKTVAGARALPLFIARDRFNQALATLSEPLLSILPVRPAKVGILVTGTEIADGLIEDRFAPVITAKVKHFQCEIAGVEIVADDAAAIAAALEKLLAAGARLIVTTAGLSVDPDDVTRAGLRAAGVDNVLRGAPILPGAMLLLGEIGEVSVIGVPACALFHKTTSFDLLLPRVLAKQPITRADLARLAEGGVCLHCANCTFPKCPFGK
ncbi:MAG TPA: trehalose-binding protein [Desulfofustis sp.]|jgi:formylmethanofuran dehydrogenase subunit E|nr:trehalose-binding protein [Desulfofustis sp. PB-SRB1]HBH30283.1 trehalose-binding protein [Desulfofustis sp.]